MNRLPQVSNGSPAKNRKYWIRRCRMQTVFELFIFTVTPILNNATQLSPSKPIPIIYRRKGGQGEGPFYKFTKGYDMDSSQNFKPDQPISNTTPLDNPSERIKRPSTPLLVPLSCSPPHCTLCSDFLSCLLNSQRLFLKFLAQCLSECTLNLLELLLPLLSLFFLQLLLPPRRHHAPPSVPPRCSN